MSNIYHTEPATSGKVLLHTTCGDIDIELWSKEAPLACRNFVQHCIDGYYNNNVFHRVIKDFMVQTGDPSGSGKGGTSIWGRPFKDEIHGRIKFNHRGQVACANEQEANSNHSQFFMTLAPCEWLDKKHTIFGKVTGNTIFNLLRLGDMDVDKADRPLEEMLITSVEILFNPFDDIVPTAEGIRAGVGADSSGADAGVGAKTASKANRKAVKDSKLLSFGDDADEEEDEETFQPKKKMRMPSASAAAVVNTTADSRQIETQVIAKSIRQTETQLTTKTGNSNIDGSGSEVRGESSSSKERLQRMKLSLAAAKNKLDALETPVVTPTPTTATAMATATTTGSSTGTKKLSVLEQQRAKFLKKATTAVAPAPTPAPVAAISVNECVDMPQRRAIGQGLEGKEIGNGQGDVSAREAQTLAMMAGFRKRRDAGRGEEDEEGHEHGHGL